MAKYLITGIAGFIGSSLAHALVKRGEQVRGIDNFLTGKRENLDGLWDRIDFREADLRDAAATQSACEGIDYIFHQGALPSVPLSVKNPEPSHRCNIDGTFNLLEGARGARVKRVVYAASSSAYGDQPVLPSRETMRPMPISPYAVQKLTGEYYMSSFWQVYGLETVSLRYFNIFGPRQAADSPYSGVLAKFILQMLMGMRPTIFGTGLQGRDFTYVDNVVSANLLAALAPAEKVAGRVFNIACGGRHTLQAVYSALAEIIGFDGEPIYGSPRNGDILNSQADIAAAAEAFGYKPIVEFREGLERTVRWYRQTLTTQSGIPLEMPPGISKATGSGTASRK
jgi:nucleoside-diphosphate-sugar epimerase